MEGNLTVKSDYGEMMKRWLYDFLFEKVIIHANIWTLFNFHVVFNTS